GEPPSKKTSTCSPDANPVPDTATGVVGWPTAGERVMVGAATALAGSATRPTTERRTTTAGRIMLHPPKPNAPPGIRAGRYRVASGVVRPRRPGWSSRSAGRAADRLDVP